MNKFKNKIAPLVVTELLLKSGVSTRRFSLVSRCFNFAIFTRRN